MAQGVAAGPAGSEGDLVTPGTAARALSVHRGTLHRWATATPPRIASVVLPSGHRRYPRAALDAIRATGAGSGGGEG